MFYLSILRMPCSTFLEKNVWLYLSGCIGSIDGTHLPVYINAWINREGILSQNVLAPCDFDLNCHYVFAGMEGSSP